VQVEIIRELPEEKTITVYRCGPLVDLCRGPHIPNTGAVKAFHISKVRPAALAWSTFCKATSDPRDGCLEANPSTVVIAGVAKVGRLERPGVPPLWGPLSFCCAPAG
jgi:hypothetical protein